MGVIIDKSVAIFYEEIAPVINQIIEILKSK